MDLIQKEAGIVAIVEKEMDFWVRKAREQLTHNGRDQADDSKSHEEAQPATQNYWGRNEGKCELNGIL